MLLMLDVADVADVLMLDVADVGCCREFFWKGITSEGSTRGSRSRAKFRGFR